MKSIEGRIGLGVAAFTLAISGVACGTETSKTNFPTCSQDPSPKTARMSVSSEPGIIPDTVVMVDDVKFQEKDRRVDMKATRPGSVSLVNNNPNHVKFMGARDGRAYDVLIEWGKNARGWDYNSLHITAVCDLKKP